MPVNYVLSFCKITAASKIFTRNFYLPLLKPITPKQALRTLRITGKWLLGAKIQHYIPALLNHSKQRSQTAPDYGKVKHEIKKDFKYVTPVIDPESNTHKALLNILKTQNSDCVFIYSIEDIKCNLVITAPLELAIRNGDVIDMMISQRSDKLVLKLSDNTKIPLETTLYTGTKQFFKGEGATTEEEEKNHHHGQWTMSLAKIFEEKERASEEWEKELQKIIQTRKKQAGEGTIEWDDMVKENVNKLDWRKFEKEAKKVIEQIGDPISERHIAMEVEDLELTKNVNETLMQTGVHQLPTIKEITEVIKNLNSAIPHLVEAEIECNGTDEPKIKIKRRVSGVKVKLSSGKECFITGQMVHTEDGEVFVPGQTIENEFGSEYAPGITIVLDNKPTLISGLIMGEEEREPMFLPTESTITSDGQLTFTTEQEVRPKPAPPKKEKYKFKTSFAELNEVEKETPVNNAAIEEAPKIKKKRKKVVKKKKEKMPELVEIPEEPKPMCETPVEIAEVIIQPSQEEIDLEEQRRLEFERMKQILMDDGMDDVISSLESKKLKLEQKLEEMRKLCVRLENDSINYVKMEDAVEIVRNITNNDTVVTKIADILLTLTRRSAAFRDKNSINVENVKNPFLNYNTSFMTDADEKLESASDKLKILLKTAVIAANDVFKTRPRDQLMAMHTLGDVISDTLKHNTELIDELCQLMNTCHERNEICTSIFRQLTQNVRENKVEVLKAAIKNNITEDDWGEVVEKISSILQNEGGIITEAFSKLAKSNHTIVKNILTAISKKIDDVVTEKSAIEILRSAIVTEVKDCAQRYLVELIQRGTDTKIKEYILEASAFAEALGMDAVVEDLRELSEESISDMSSCEANTFEFLKRLAVVRLLSQKDYYLKAALERVKKNPECAKTDPRVRQLLRQSAAVFSDSKPLRNSREIPLRLMRSQNLLAIEDFLVQRGQMSYPVLINRQELQAVVPKEASRAVLSGRVPYLLIDESGFTSIKPVDMLNGFKSAKDRHKRYEDIGNGYVDEKNRRFESSPTAKSIGQVRKQYKKLLNNRRRLA